jgi:hypothetical protein
MAYNPMIMCSVIGGSARFAVAGAGLQRVPTDGGASGPSRRIRRSRVRVPTRLVAACRSIREVRALRSIGPSSRSSTARSIARATAGGRGTRTTLPPLPRTLRTRWPCSSPRSAMLAPQASKIRSPRSPSIATRAKSLMLADSRAAVIIASNWRWLRPRVGDSGGTSGRRT